MDTAVLVSVVGVVTILTSILGSNISPVLAERRWAILTIGIIVVLVGVALGLPRLVGGLHEGWQPGATH